MEGFPNRQLLHPVCLLCAEKTHLILVIVTTRGLSYKSCSYNLQGICCVPVIIQDMLIREFLLRGKYNCDRVSRQPRVGTMDSGPGPVCQLLFPFRSLLHLLWPQPLCSSQTHRAAPASGALPSESLFLEGFSLPIRCLPSFWELGPKGGLPQAYFVN